MNKEIQLYFVNLAILDYTAIVNNQVGTQYNYSEVSAELEILQSESNFKTIDKEILVKFNKNNNTMQEVKSNENIPLIFGAIFDDDVHGGEYFSMVKSIVNYNNAGVFLGIRNIYSNDSKSTVPYILNIVKREKGKTSYSMNKTYPLDLINPETAKKFDKYLDENNANDVRNFILSTLWDGYNNHQEAIQLINKRQQQFQANVSSAQARLRRIGL